MSDLDTLIDAMVQGEEWACCKSGLTYLLRRPDLDAGPGEVISALLDRLREAEETHRRVTQSAVDRVHPNSQRAISFTQRVRIAVLRRDDESPYRLYVEEADYQDYEGNVDPEFRLDHWIEYDRPLPQPPPTVRGEVAE